MAQQQQQLAQGDPGRSGGREPVLVHRRRWHQHDPQQRAHVDQPQAAVGSATAAPRTSSPGWHRKLAQVEGIQLFMEPVQNITVDDRVSRTQYQYTLEDPDPNELNLWTDRFVDRAAAAARDHQRRHRPAAGRAGGVPGHRSHHRLAARHRARDHRQHAVRRLRPAPDQHDVHAGESVPRHPGERSAVSAGPRQAEPHLHPVQRLRGCQPARAPRPRSHRSALLRPAPTRPPARRSTPPTSSSLAPPSNALAASPSSTGLARGSRSAGATSSTLSNAVPLSAFCAFREDHRAAGDHAPGPVSGHHGVVRSDLQ